MPETPVTTSITPAKSANPRGVDYARKIPRGPKGDRIADILKTLVWVIPLTILIWFYAEREQSTAIENVTIPIGVRINSPDKLVTLNDPADGKIVATLSGPRTSVQRVLDRINSHPDLPIMRTLDASTPRGITQLPASAIDDDPIFAQNGIKVRAVSPQTLRVTIDDVVTDNLPVRAPPGIELEGGMRFSPGVVRVTAPRTILEQAKRLQQDESRRTHKLVEDKLYVTADPSKLAELIKVPGTHENEPGISVTLESLPGPNIKIEPSSVSANFVVPQKLKEYTAKNVPIWLTAPEGTLRAIDIEIVGAKALAAVTIVGPPEQIDAFKEAYENGRLDPVFAALIDLDYPKDKGEVSKPATFRLQDGLHLKAGQNLTVDVRVTPKNS